MPMSLPCCDSESKVVMHHVNLGVWQSVCVRFNERISAISSSQLPDRYGHRKKCVACVRLRASHMRNMARRSCVAQLVYELRAGACQWYYMNLMSIGDLSE